MIRTIIAGLGAVAILALAPATVQAQDLPEAASAPSPAFDAFRPLIGKTWRGQAIHQPGVEDIMRWDWALGGHAVRTRHSVNGGAYGGESLMFPDKDTGEVIFHYFTTGGFHTTGVIRVVGPGAFEIEETVHGVDGLETLKSRTTLGEDGVYRTRAMQMKDGVETEFGGFDYRPDETAEIVLPLLDGVEASPVAD